MTDLVEVIIWSEEYVQDLKHSGATRVEVKLGGAYSAYNQWRYINSPSMIATTAWMTPVKKGERGSLYAMSRDEYYAIVSQDVTEGGYASEVSDG